MNCTAYNPMSLSPPLPPSLPLSPALCSWLSLCKTLTANSSSDDLWKTIEEDFQFFRQLDRFDLDQSALENIKSCDPASAPPLFALAVGATENSQAEAIYSNMMELAKYRGRPELHVHCLHVCQKLIVSECII